MTIFIGFEYYPLMVRCFSWDSSCLFYYLQATKDSTMELRETYNSFSRFSEDDPPHISKLKDRAHPKLKRNLFEESENSNELVQVYLRVKPTNVPNSLYAIYDDRTFVTSVDTTSAGHGRRTQNNVSKVYKFSHIFGPEGSQKEIFDRLVKDNLLKLTTEGQGYTLLTYGASGSGKTYTLMGTEVSPGLVPHSLEYLFKLVDAAQYPVYKLLDGQAERLSYDQQAQELQWVSKLREVSIPLRDKYRRMSVRLSTDFGSTIDLTEKTQYYIWVSFVEIYNEAIYDLLAPGDRRMSSKLIIREDTNGNVYVKGARHAFVRSGAEAYDVMVAGKHNLQVAATGVHANSSRSHCIFTITLLMDTPSGVKMSSVKLCDLAGSERANRTRNTGIRLIESRSINKSLHVLERCLNALRQNNHNVLVPYRDSKLTRLLGSGLSGVRGEPVTMLVTVNTSPHYINETKHVLQLASVVKDIQINNTVFEQSSTLGSTEDISLSFNSEIMKLRSENERIQFELVQLLDTHRKLEATIEEERGEHARSTKEIVQEVKDMSKQYYEAQIESIKKQHTAEMDEVLAELRAARKSNAVNKDYLLKMVSAIEEKFDTNGTLTTQKLIKELRLYIEEKEEDEEQILEHQRSSTTQDLKRLERDYMRHTCSTIDVSPRESKDLTVNSVRESQNNVFNISHEDSEVYDSVINESKNKSTNVTIDDSTDSIDEQICKRGTYFVRSSGSNKNDLDLLNNLNKVEEITSENKGNDQNISIDNNCTVNDNLDSPMVDHNETDNKAMPIRISSTELEMNNEPKPVDTPEINAVKLLSKIITIDSNTSSDFDSECVETRLERQFTESSLSDAKQKSVEKADSINSNSFKVITVDSNPSSDCDKTTESPLEMKVTKTYTNNFKTSVTRESSVNGSLTLFEKFEDAVNKEIAEQNKADAIEESSFFTFKKKSSYFKNVKDVAVINDKNNEDGSAESATINKAPCTSLIKCALSPKETSLDILALPQGTAKNTDASSFFTYKERTTYFSNLKDIEVINEEVNNEDVSETTTIINKSPGKLGKLKLLPKGISLDIFESPQIIAQETTRITDACIEKLDKTINKQSSVQDYKTDFFTYNENKIDNDAIVSVESVDSKEEVIEQISKSTCDVSVSQNADITKTIENDTLDAFENICKDMTTSRTTEFDLLVTNELQETSKKDELEISKANTKNSKYNFRNRKNADEKIMNAEIKADEPELRQTRPRRRLRRFKNVEEEDIIKLNNIENLKDEYCDMISDKPAPPKVKREPSTSPGKLLGDEENVPPIELQSCPAKSLTRSRRKLFTPRAEPLDQSVSGDSGGPVRVPRPSYTKGRARRRL